MIVFMGVAGSGKSMQGKLLADELGLPWLSTGEFLRMLISGKQRRDMVDGKLLDDQQIIALVQKIFHLINSNEEFVLDGFPRSSAQADWLLSQVKHGQLKITAVIHLQASLETVEKRLLSRSRPDDTAQAISERFVEYEKAIKPILDHFRSAGITVCEIDAEQKPPVVHEAIVKAIQDVHTR